MDYDEQSREFRASSTTAQRTAPARMLIDPGFVHHRKIETLLGERGAKLLNAEIERLPPNLPDHLRSLRIDHIYMRLVMALCATVDAPPLARLLANERGRLFCSVEEVAPCPDVHKMERVASAVRLKGAFPYEVKLEYSTAKIAADTTRMELANGSEIALVAEYRWREGDTLFFEPLVMGGPQLEPADPRAIPDAMWLGFAFGEVFVEDIDELARVREAPVPTDFSAMSVISEAAFKQCLAEVLGVHAPKDWSGEQSDLYSAHVSLNSERVTAALLLKGPGGGFKPMTLNTLGKNNDQIVRLANEPADLLVVQHCHDVLQPVRATLRAFATRLGELNRRYCVMDGKDSLRVLQAYDKLDRALDLST